MIPGWYKIFEKRVFFSVDVCFLFNIAILWDRRILLLFLMDVPAGCHLSCSVAVDLHIPVLFGL